jgi:hypothetical protein
MQAILLPYLKKTTFLLDPLYYYGTGVYVGRMAIVRALPAYAPCI